MKIFITDIKDKILVREETVSAKKWELDTDEIKFLDGIALYAEFSRAGHEILVDVTVTMHREMVCCRCLDTFKQDDEFSFMLSYDSSECGAELDIDEDIREEVLLNWPMKTLCSDDCKGLDPNTGEKL